MYNKTAKFLNCNFPFKLMLSVINMSNINIINDNCKNAQSRIIGILLSFIEKPVISLIITY